MSEKIVEEDYVSIPEAAKILSKLNSEELTPVQRRVLEYVTKFSKINPEKASELKSILISDFEIEPELAVQLVNIMPKTVEELRTVLRTGRWRLTSTETLSKILEVLDKYRVENKG